MRNITKVFVNVSFRIVARKLALKGMTLNYYFLFWDIVWATKPSGNESKEIVNEERIFKVKQNVGWRIKTMLALLFELRIGQIASSVP